MARRRGVMAKGSLWLGALLLAVAGLGGCVGAQNVRADRDWYTLKEATNGRNMVSASLKMCENDPTCSPSERAELQKSCNRAEADYQKALRDVNFDHAHGWYADVDSMPNFARDPTLGLDP
jgi:hypothetical protein